MAYHDELLKHAFDLVHKDPADPKQADLRRAVSAAYYALFHLLISELIAFWSHTGSKAALARMPQHRAMAEASRTIQPMPFSGEDISIVRKLKEVAQAFVQLHDKREKADYDNATYWSHTESLSEVTLAAKTYVTWDSIRNEPIAQTYVASLLVKRAKGL